MTTSVPIFLKCQQLFLLNWLTDSGAADPGADLNPTFLFMDPRNRKYQQRPLYTQYLCFLPDRRCLRWGLACPSSQSEPVGPEPPDHPEHGTRIRRNATDFMLGYDLSPSPTSTVRIGEVSASQRVEILRKGRKRVNVAFSGDGGGGGGGRGFVEPNKTKTKKTRATPTVIL